MRGKNSFKYSEAWYLCLIHLSMISKDFEKYNFWSQTVLNAQSIKFVHNLAEVKRFEWVVNIVFNAQKHDICA